jgi:hypothetical protein
MESGMCQSTATYFGTVVEAGLYFMQGGRVKNPYLNQAKHILPWARICKRLKGQCHEILDFWFFSWLSFPQAPEYTIRDVSNFSKIRGDIHVSRFTTGVVDTGGKWKIFNQKNFDLIVFAFKFTLRYLQPYIVPIVCCWCRWYLWQFATSVVDTGGKFAAGIVDSGGKFATGINNTSEIGGKICCRCRWYWWCTLTCEYLRKFSKTFETVLMGYSGAGGKLIHEKKLEAKILVHCPFKTPRNRFCQST